MRIVIIALAAVLLAQPAFAAGKHHCHDFSKANHCKAKHDKRAGTCTCIGPRG